MKRIWLLVFVSIAYPAQLINVAAQQRDDLTLLQQTVASYIRSNNKATLIQSSKPVARKQAIRPKQSAPSRQASTANTSVKTIGIIFNTWSVNVKGHGDDIPKEPFRKALQAKSSISPDKLQVVIPETMEDARKESIEVIFSIDYAASPGLNDQGLIARYPDIFCIIRRVDKHNVTTNWDNLYLKRIGEKIKFAGTNESMRTGGIERNSVTESQLYATAASAFENSIPVLRFSSSANTNRLSSSQQSLVSITVNRRVAALVAANGGLDAKDGLGYTLLMRASELGDIDAVRVLLTKEADVNAKGSYGTTALLQAVRGANTEVVKILLEKGADINAKDNYNNTALSLAISLSLPFTTLTLLDKGADVKVRLDKGETYLIYAASRGNRLIIESLLDKGIDINAKDIGGVTALLAAIKQGHAKVVRDLLNREANVNAISLDGSTALFIALKSGYVEIVKDLISKGANVNMRSRDGETPLLEAIRRGYVKHIETGLIPPSEKQVDENRRIIEALLAGGADVNAKNEQGDGAILESTRLGNVEFTRMLLAAGANVNMKGFRDIAPLAYAIENNNAALVKMLLDRGADVNIKGASGEPILVIASGKGNVATVKALLEKGADVNATGVSGRTALIEASWNGDISIVQALLEKGPDLNASDKGNRTALMTAIYRERVTIVQLLLAKGVDVNAKYSGFDRYDLVTPLDLAQRMRNTAIIKLLKEAGAK
jgi:uncharacterized protein